VRKYLSICSFSIRNLQFNIQYLPLNNTACIILFVHSGVADRVDTLLGTRQFAAALVLAQGALRTVRGVKGAEDQVTELDSRVETALLGTLADMESR
jgi:hypothetical protein